MKNEALDWIEKAVDHGYINSLMNMIPSSKTSAASPASRSSWKESNTGGRILRFENQHNLLRFNLMNGWDFPFADPS